MALSMEVLINARSTAMDALCANLDSALVELMECLDKLEVLRRRFSESVSKVVKHSLLQILSHFHTHPSGIFQPGKDALFDGFAICERPTL